MQAKPSKDEVFNLMLRVFYRMNTLGRNEMLVTLIVEYPERYQEFIDRMDKEVYNKFMVRA